VSEACGSRFTYRVLVVRHVGKRQLRRPRLDGVRILKEMRWVGMDLIFLAEERYRRRAILPAVMNLPFSLNCGEFFDWLRTC